MEQNEKHLLTIKTSRITSIKGFFFPMEYIFSEVDGKLKIIKVTRNWIGQRTSTKEIALHFGAKGVILRKLKFANYSGDIYGRFWSSDIKKVKEILQKYKPKSSFQHWSDTWF